MPEHFTETYRDGYCLTDDLTRISTDTVFAWLSTEAYWSMGRSRATIDTAFENSYLYGVLDSDGATVACLRVVSDRATFAWFSDVFVAREHRGEGIGTWMVEVLTAYWTALGVHRILLATTDAHEVYRKAGFAPLASPERFMEIDRRSRP